MAAPWKLKEPEGQFEPAPAGNHPAVLVAIVDLGHQEQEYQGKVTRPHRAMFVWELVNEPDPARNDGSNHLVGMDLTLSVDDRAKLKKWIEARLGKAISAGYDVTQEIGKPCLLNVKHVTTSKGKTYAKIEGMSAPIKNMSVPKAKTQPFLWSLDDLPTDGSEPDLPDWLPRLYGKKLADVIAECVELNPEKDADTSTRAKVPTGNQADPGDEDVVSPDGDKIPF